MGFSASLLYFLERFSESGLGVLISIQEHGRVVFCCRLKWVWLERGRSGSKPAHKSSQVSSTRLVPLGSPWSFHLSLQIGTKKSSLLGVFRFPFGFCWQASTNVLPVSRRLRCHHPTDCIRRRQRGQVPRPGRPTAARPAASGWHLPSVRPSAIGT